MKLHAPFLLLLLVASLASAQTATLHVRANGPTKLIVAMGFNESAGTTVSDISGLDNNGVFAGSGNTWTASGKHGGALVLNGSGYVLVPNNDTLNASVFTISTQINPTSVGGFRAIAARYDPSSNGNDYYFYASNEASLCGVDGYAGGGFDFGSGLNSAACDNALLSLNTWTHVALVYDGANLTYYKNGVAIQSTPTTYLPLESLADLYIGGSIFGETFRGMLDDFRFYNGAIPLNNGTGDLCTDTAPSITRDMNCGVGITPIPTTAITMGADANIKYGNNASILYGK